MAVEETNLKFSLSIFLACFYIYAFMIHAFYDCNLRAYLMSPNLEPVADNAREIYEQVTKLKYTNMSNISIEYHKGEKLLQSA